MYSSMLSSANVELVLDGGQKRLRVHSAILELTSDVFRRMLSEESCVLGEQSGETIRHPQQLQLDDDSRDWEVVLPLLYPRMSPPRLDWTELRRVVAITKKYEIRLLRHACERFLEEAQLSAHSADPNYVLTWLLVSEQLELGALFSKCLQFLDSHLAPRAPGFCDYCSTRSRSASAGSGAGSSSNGDPNSRIGCTCACAVCGGSTLRRDCRCGRDVESMLPAGSGSSSTGGHGAAFGHGSTTAATYIGPTAGGSGSGSGSGRNYPGMPAPLAAAYEATARSRYAAAPGPAAASGARRDLQLLYRRDGAAAPTAAPAAALRIQVHAPTAAALVQRYASPMPTRVHISVRSNGSGGSASSTGRGVLTSPISGGSAAHARPLVPPPAPVLPRVVELVRGDRKHLVKLSVPTLVELLGML
ncbi:hypothetical protein CHLRE_16g680800v5 [Chlamydomonas reinhardtii]|uniref:BTB domain-containing protein n=1 Tax=Chlamydomonas reinhardtii TaxID=3055 RepID=A0A2K3CV30_CHLRE|nr:uncharacterized protein CHLRE_16g680800v5 [Chlamydomonas reinhardtii]PNW72142.1 hypothetical protein CHLRE_16g680800v5 [Chlamydomonas reinhardtii]